MEEETLDFLQNYKISLVLLSYEEDIKKKNASQRVGAKSTIKVSQAGNKTKRLLIGGIL